MAQIIFIFFSDQYKADIVFVVHASNKVNYRNFRIYLNFLRQLITEMDIESGAIRVALVTYGKSANVAFFLNSHTVRSVIRKGIMRLPRKIRSGKADLTKAFQLLRTDVFTAARGDRPDAANGIFLFTDMSITEDFSTAVQEAQALVAGGASIYAIGIGSADGEELRQISLVSSGQSVYSANNYLGLNSLLPILRSRMLPCKAIMRAFGHIFIQNISFVVI